MNYKTFLKTPSYLIIYCWWLWLWALLFYLNFITISPLPSLFIAFLFSFIFIQLDFLYSTANFFFKLFIIFFEFFILNIIYFKKKIINKKDVMINAFVFAFYNIYLYFVFGINMYHLYFKHLKRKINKKQNHYFKSLLKINQTYFFIIFIILLTYNIKSRVQ